MTEGLFLVRVIIPILLLSLGGIVVWRFVRNVRRQTPDTRTHRGNDGPAPSLQDVYRLARKRGGYLTVSQVVVDLDVGPMVAERILQDATDEIRVHMDIKNDGRVIYRFSELLENADNH